MNIAFVWPAKDWTGLGKIPSDQAQASVGLWPTVLDCDIIGFPYDEFVAKPEWDKYDLFIVNHFGVGQPVLQLRRAFPKAKILALVDPALEVVLSMTTHFNPVFFDLKYADAFGGRTKYDAQFYQVMTGIKSFWIPSPIGWYGAFEKYRQPLSKRKDFVVTTDHPLKPNISAHNLAFGKMIYKLFGLKTKYLRPKPTTVETAQTVGHEGIEFIDRLEYADFCELVSQCMFGFDLYWMHSQGRTAQTFAMCKTPLIGSINTNRVGGIEVNPMNLDAAAGWVTNLFYSGPWRKSAAESMFFTEQNYGFSTSKKRMEHVIQWMFS